MLQQAAQRTGDLEALLTDFIFFLLYAPESQLQKARSPTSVGSGKQAAHMITSADGGNIWEGNVCRRSKLRPPFPFNEVFNYLLSGCLCAHI